MSEQPTNTAEAEVPTEDEWGDEFDFENGFENMEAAQPIDDGGAETIQTTSVRESDENVRVGFQFPAGTDPSIIKETMAQVAKMTADRIKAKSSMDESRDEYRRNGHRRFKCKVLSLRPKVKYFDMIISHPTTDKPVKVFGKCGVILENGLTQYTIDRLNESYTMVTEEIEGVDPDSSMALTYRAVRMPNFRVEMRGEIENPKKVGSIGRSKQQG